MRIINTALNLLYPPKCGICGKIGNYLCNDCYEKIKKYQINKEIKNKENNTICIYKYEEIIRDLLIKYKFNDASYLYKSFLECIIKNKKVCNFINSYDIILAVPLHRRRKLERGYNQVELITKEISKVLKKQTYNDILIKTVNIKPQSTKGLKDRINNVKGVYKVENIERISNQTILIFDDIYTTGSTCNECRKVLLQAGAKKVGILTIAKDYLK